MKKSIKVLIVEDESDAQDLILGMLKEYYPDIEVLGCSLNIDDAFDRIRSEKPNLVFLDVNLPRGSGINLLERFPVRKFEAIVISGYPDNQQFLQKFKDVPFLEKPFTVDDFKDLTDQKIKQIKKNPYAIHRYE
jgi:two-component system LytT family response regulator